MFFAAALLVILAQHVQGLAEGQMYLDSMAMEPLRGWVPDVTSLLPNGAGDLTEGEDDGLIENWQGRLDWAPLNVRQTSRRTLVETLQPPLTELGSNIETVVFASMLGGTCQSDDWRGDLPRHLMSFLPKASGVLVYARDSGSHTCRSCTSHGVKHTRDKCMEYLGNGGEAKKADLLVVIGTGRINKCRGDKTLPGCGADDPSKYVSLDRLFHSRYTSNTSLTVHVPVRKLAALWGNKVFQFDHVIPDNEFLKPIAMEAYDDMMGYCSHVKKSKRLLYVGRYVDKKGQVEFLSMVNPQHLSGYTVDFYGAGYESKSIIDNMRKIAKERGISITINKQVDHAKLLRLYCAASGQIHFAKGDNNPRAAYEGLYAGNPLFVTLNSKLPAVIYKQPFVAPVWANATSGIFNQSFGRFMEMVKSSSTRKRISIWVDSNMRPDSVYRGLCSRIGVCQ